MYETHLTVVGKLVTGVEQRRFANGSVRSTFRLVSKERRLDKATDTWADGERLFVEVTCWRRLAENVFASLLKGDAVVVTGRFYTREYEHEGRPRSTTTLEALSVAADLNWCTAVINRSSRRAEEPAGDESADDGRAPDDAVRLVGAAPGGEG